MVPPAAPGPNVLVNRSPTRQTDTVTDGIDPAGDARPASPRPEERTQRVADADRDRMVTTLREQVAVGRLTLDEFSDRVGDALAARTRPANSISGSPGRWRSKG